MLKANVGLSRKLSENYQSTGFSLNLEGEINATLEDPEAVIERVRELYDLANEALQRQIEAHQSDSAIASRDADPQPANNGHSSRRPAPEANGHASRDGQRDERPQTGEPATNKQVQFLSTLAKRQKLFGPKLDVFIEETIGRRCTPYDLTKKEAGDVIEALNPEPSENNHSRR